MTAVDILFVDDDRAILDIVHEYLVESGYRVEVVDNGLTALERIKEKAYPIVFTDIKMPDIDGLELLAAIKQLRPETEVIIVTGHGSMESAIRAMKTGSYDYLQKPFKLNVLKILIDRIVDEKRLQQEKIILRARVKDRSRYDALVGINPMMQEIYDSVERMRGSGENVLIEGETGTGKELLAQVIHRTSVRSNRPMIPLTCQSIFRNLAEDRYGERVHEILASAAGGTLFLDEVCELPPQAQAHMAALRGESEARSDPAAGPASVRLIAATQRPLREAVAKGILSSDLAAVLNRVHLRMPPLRERKEDICPLINHFLYQFNTHTPKKVYAVDPEAMDYCTRRGRGDPDR
ncbi:MAG: response regulator [Desulfobacterales bacterium]|nr:response regulator [Desulfobacterales bacterium]